MECELGGRYVCDASSIALCLENPLPEYVAVPCGVSQTRVFANPTSRAARKAAKGSGLYFGQAQSTRTRTLKNCITQINTSEIAFNQVSRSNVCIRDCVAYQSIENLPVKSQLTPPSYNAIYSYGSQPDLNIIAYDPSGSLYSLTNYIDAGDNHLTLSKFDNSNNLVITANLDLSADVISATLNSTNLFWRNDILVFVGIFNATKKTLINIYTFDDALQNTLRLQLTQQSTKLYSGQSTFDNNGYIYITLASLPSGGYETSPMYYISPEFTPAPSTSIQDDYITIQDSIGDTYNGAFIAANSSSGTFLVYVYAGTYFWSQNIFAAATCAMAISSNNIIVTLGAQDTILVLALFSYVPNSVIYAKINEIDMSNKIIWPNGIPYQITDITVCYKSSGSRLFYTLQLYNPDITNFKYYIQNGEFDLSGNILWSINIQVSASFNISLTNTIQASYDYLMVASGINLTRYATTQITYPPTIVNRTRLRQYCITEIKYPGCPSCPVLPTNNNEPLTGLTRTLNLAICQPIQFSNPAASDGCAPVYAPPTQYLTEAEGAEPPQGPAAKIIVRQYDRINGIDEICKPIPGRFGSTRTARIRTNIESASTTRYVDTVLPLVQYPLPCPVYGNQTGIPRATRCRPTIDGRPTSLFPRI